MGLFLENSEEKLLLYGWCLRISEVFKTIINAVIELKIENQILQSIYISFRRNSISVQNADVLEW